MDRVPPSARPTDAANVRLARGTTLGRYVVDGWLREGGMAVIHRGHHVVTKAKVAIKVQRPCEEDAATVAARFAREAEVMGRLSSAPNVVRVLDVNTLGDGRAYVVTEWIEGDTLEELLDRVRDGDATLGIARACRVLADIARALAAAHRVGVVHRDVKPSNVMIDRSLGDREVAKLLDFGISADLGAEARGEHLTATGLVLGTSSHVAPEQALGLPADPAFDVYALGVVMFEAITGRAVPPAELGPARLPPVKELRAGVPDEIDGLVARCMARDPGARPSAAEVAELLEGLAAKPAPGAASDARATGHVVGQAWWWALGVLIAAGAGAGAWWMLEHRGEGTAPSEGDAGTTSHAVTTAASARVLGEAEASTPAAGSESSGGDESEERHSATTGAATTTDGAAEVGAASTGEREPPALNCRRLRNDAETALGRRDWWGVIRASAARECWSSSVDRGARKAMRVKAWLELERWSRCVDEGGGDTDPRVARLTKHCREKLAERGG